MNVNEIYNLIENAVCLQCRKDKRNINSGIVSHDAEARVLLDNGDSNLVRYIIYDTRIL